MKVSVVVTTFNHERYIAQALDSVLDQELDGGYEVLVSEDCSTDNTRVILRDYQSRHPATIRLMMSPRNLNTNEVLRRGLEAADAPYVALLDGDDYWTSRQKLATQVRQLEEQPELSISFHNVRVVYEDASSQSHPFHLEQPNKRLSAPIPKAVSTLPDLLRGNFIQTCSAVFRRESLPELPGWYDGLGLGDWPLYVLLAERGGIAYIDEILAVYRVHSGGHWSANLSRLNGVEDVASIVRIYEVLDRHLRFRYTDRIKASVDSFCDYAAELLEHGGRPEEAGEVRRLANRGWKELRREASWAAAARGIERSRSWRVGRSLVRAFRLLTFRRPATPTGPAELAAKIEEHVEAVNAKSEFAEGQKKALRREISWAAAARGIERSRSWRVGRSLVRAFRLLTFRRPATPKGPAELAAKIEEHVEAVNAKSELAATANAEPDLAARIGSPNRDRQWSTGVIQTICAHVKAPGKTAYRYMARWRARRQVLRPTILGPHPLTPVSREFGFDRGKPIDRHYIEDFLRRHGDYSGYSEGDIKGDVMEVGGDDYTRRFGGANVSSVDVLHASAANPAATLIGDLATGEGVPSERYDCIICTQTLQFIYRIHEAVETLHRALKPGGVLLATFPGITQSTPPDRDHWGDYWRLTSGSATRLFGERFQPSEVLVEAYGNLASATGFLHGLVTEDLRADELDARDPDYELLIAVRARRTG